MCFSVSPKSVESVDSNSDNDIYETLSSVNPKDFKLCGWVCSLPYSVNKFTRVLSVVTVFKRSRMLICMKTLYFANPSFE